MIISRTQPEIAPIFIQKAQQEDAPIYFADQEFELSLLKQNLIAQFYKITKKEQILFPELELGLGGNYQQFNLPGVLKVVEVLQNQGYIIAEEAIKKGLREVKKITGFKGRWQVISDSPLTICDTGHNVDGLKQIIKQLQELKRPRVHFIFGVVNDKDVNGILQLLPSAFVYYYCQANLPRALPAADLAKMAADFGLKGFIYPNVNVAYEVACQAADAEDLIFIGGSTFVVAEFAGL